MEEMDDLDRAFIETVDELKPPAVAAELGAGTSTVYRQASMIKKGEASLSGAIRTKFIEYQNRQPADAGDTADGDELGHCEGRQAASDIETGTRIEDPDKEPPPVEWEAEDITEARRTLRVADHRDTVAGNSWDLITTYVGRVPGVVPEHPVEDEVEYFGMDVSELLKRRRHIMRLVGS